MQGVLYMKIKWHFLSVILAVAIAITTFAGCGSVAYEGGALEDATVGVQYYCSVATAESEDVLDYRLSSDSALPSGLSLQSGAVTGIPAAAVEDHAFVVEAYSGDSKVAQADFSITVGRGKIEYADCDAYSIINRADSGTVAFATGAPQITYELVGGTMPNGMSIASDGTILGTWARIMRNRQITVRASAPDCDSAEANINFNVIYPYLTFTGRTLADARQGVEYAASVAYVAEESADVSYSLKEGSVLPEGLTMDENGVITGTATTVMRGMPFTVVAEADNYSDTEAQFVIDVVIDRQSASEGEILNFNGGALADAYQDTYYLNQRGVAEGVISLNNNNITYTLAEGSELPEGITLYSNGAVLGKATAIRDYTFSVIAHADGCDDKTATFTLSVKGSRIDYATSISADTATRGEPYLFSVATANAGDGVKITYSTDDAAKLNEIGLSMNEDGLITGTPTKSLKSMNFSVTASAEGYTSSSATVYLHVQEPLTEATVFEAEYTDLASKTGTGYSGSPSAEGLISNGRNFGASNGYFVGYMHNGNISLEFNIESAEDTSVTLILRLGSEFGNVTLTPSSFGISVNGEEITYSGLSVPGGADGYSQFADCVVGTINLKKGSNEIKLSVRSNTLRDGSTGGPGVDCIKLEGASCALSWRPLVYNFDSVQV